jgi:hypothetical protein
VTSHDSNGGDFVPLTAETFGYLLELVGAANQK